jgi:hypothetical protein
LPDLFEFPYRGKDANGDESQEQYYQDHLSSPYPQEARASLKLGHSQPRQYRTLADSPRRK